jgi:uncharacterized sulfatase
MKQSLFEESGRVPLIFAGPGVPSRGQTCKRTVEFLDLYPTLAEMARLEPPANLEGRSLGPLLRQPSRAWDHPAVTQTQRSGKDGPFMGYTLRTERWRYTEWDGGAKGRELYDHQRDPGELVNLGDDPKCEATARALRQRLHTIIKRPSP